MMTLVSAVLAVTPVAGDGQPPATAGEGEGEGASSFEPAYPAQPEPGTLYWGAAVGGNGDPAARHEEPAGSTMAIRRPFFRWHHRTSGWLEQIVRDDHRNGRLPWVSVKTPHWRDVAEGKHDEQVDQLLKLLRDQEQPIWLTVWHEPENDADAEARDRAMGTPADHLAMNRRFR